MVGTVTLSLAADELHELRAVAGEHRRICRDQVYRYVQGDYQKSDNEVSCKRLQIAESLCNKIEIACNS